MAPLRARFAFAAVAARAAFAVAALVAFAHPAAAHQSSISYLTIAPAGHDVHLTVEIANADLYEAVGAARDRAVDKAEVLAARARILDYVAARIHVHNGGAECPPAPRTLSIDDKSDGFFATVAIDYECKRTAAELTVEYDLFFDLDPMHQGLARVQLPGEPERQHVFRGAARALDLRRPLTLADNLRDYLVLGMEHIFTGYDHIAFLFGLLLVAAARGLRRGLGYVLGIVTAFTVAHSVTLIAAGLGIVRLSPRIVEPAIALSIAYVAVENLVVREPKHRWLLTFGFGLVHGFGFASVLAEIGLPPSGVVPSLVSFNVGVELGQLCVVTAVAPILLWLVPRAGQATRVRTWGSVLLLALSSLWFFERVLGKSFFRGWLG
jgi:hypothetical protein